MRLLHLLEWMKSYVLQFLSQAHAQTPLPCDWLHFHVVCVYSHLLPVVCYECYGVKHTDRVRINACTVVQLCCAAVLQTDLHFS